MWKHLPLVEVLAIEQPVEYWESHAGSSSYPLTPSPGRDFGIYRFLDRAGAVPALARSRYRGHLGGDAYPGSATLAMRTLGRRARYLFCDTDRDSVASLRDEAGRLGVAARCVEDDGMTALWTSAERLADPGQVLVHIDPFEPFAAPGGLSTVELAVRLANRGLAVVYWYGLSCHEERGWAYRAIGAQVDEDRLWAGEVALAGFQGSCHVSVGSQSPFVQAQPRAARRPQATGSSDATFLRM